ncbi:MAG TPA: hypothetical protein VE820_13400 [Sphingomicrobium sp.]|jgi:hypothetical protein|nr:hypothetical protein [Sphingomicrobium sp.]
MFDYVMTLAGVIIGLALTHLMQGIAGLIEEREKIWWVHLVWVAYMCLTSVFWWWFEYMLHGVQQWTFAIYIFVLGYAFVTYMSAAVLFPRQMAAFSSYEDYFIARRGWFFALQIIGFTIDPIDSALKGRAHLASLGSEYWISIVVSDALALLAIVTPRRSVQAAVALLFLVYNVSWIARLFETIP